MPSELSPLVRQRSFRHVAGDLVTLDIPLPTSPLSAQQAALWSHALNPFRRSGFVVTFLLFLLIVSGTGQKVFFRLMLFPMADYVLLVNQIQALSFVPLFFVFAECNKRFVHSGAWPKEMKQTGMQPAIIIGVLEMFNMLLQLFGGARLGGALQVLLAQVRIPVTMIFSRVLLGAEYNVRQFIGVGVVFVGIVTAVGLDLNGEGGSHSLFWCFVFMSSALPSCLANVLREKVLNQNMDPFLLGYHVALCQFLLGLPFIVVFAPLTGLSLRDVPSNFDNGLHCWLFGENAAPGVGTQDCADAPFAVWAFLLSNFGYNIVQLLVFKYASATIQIVATTMIIPLSGMAFSLPAVMGRYAQPWRPREIVGALLVGSGILIYKSVLRFGVQTLKFSFGMSSSEVGLPFQNVHPPSDPRNMAVRLFLADDSSESTPATNNSDSSEDDIP